MPRKAKRKPGYDVHVRRSGSLYTFELLTANADLWWYQNVGTSYTSVESRYAVDIYDGMRLSGLRVF